MKMDLIVTEPVFNPDLTGHAVRLRGLDEEGDVLDGLYLVHNVHFNKMTLVNAADHIITVYLSEFEEAGAADGLVFTVISDES